MLLTMNLKLPVTRPLAFVANQVLGLPAVGLTCPAIQVLDLFVQRLAFELPYRRQVNHGGLWRLNNHDGWLWPVGGRLGWGRR